MRIDQRQHLVAETRFDDAERCAVLLEPARPELRGKAKQAVGDLTDDERLRDEGELDEATGRVREGFGRARRKVGETIEDVGERIKRP